MTKDKNSAINEMLMFGVGILIIGLILASYSVSTYMEIKDLGEKIDFEMIDSDTKLTASDKYYKYVAISEFLTKKLNKNKSIPIKNASCVYMDYAQTNALKMYYLTDKKLNFDVAKKNASAENIRNLNNMYDSYKTCKHQAEYKAELAEILKEIENVDKKQDDSEQRMNNFLSGYKEHSIDEYEQSMNTNNGENLTQEQYEQLMQEQQLMQTQQQESEQSVNIPDENQNNQQ